VKKKKKKKKKLVLRRDRLVDPSIRNYRALSLQTR